MALKKKIRIQIRWTARDQIALGFAITLGPNKNSVVQHPTSNPSDGYNFPV
jgi:hypothetical protein